jgi:hypothetical protein
MFHNQGEHFVPQAISIIGITIRGSKQRLLIFHEETLVGIKSSVKCFYKADFERDLARLMRRRRLLCGDGEVKPTFLQEAQGN